MPKKGNVQECSNYHTTALISYASKVMLKILQLRLQQYVNQELSDVQAEFSKGRGTRDQNDNIQWITEKAQESQENTYFCFTGYVKAFGWITTNYGKFLKRWEYQTTSCLLRNLYGGQKATVRSGHGTTDWFQIGKGVCQGYTLSSCLFKLYAEYTM